MNPSIMRLINLIQPIEPICKALHLQKARTYLVGGSVRDIVLHRPTKDIDIEIHDITVDDAQKILSTFGPVIIIGKKFGVLRISHLDVDWSFPRTDSMGRKPNVEIDPFMGIKLAARRRDLTMNAMAFDLEKIFSLLDDHQEISLSSILIDPFDGMLDINRKILRAPDNTLFAQDPLRFFRVMHFMGRFGMTPDERLNTICSTMALEDPLDRTPLAKERIQEEFKKLFTLSEKPSQGLLWLVTIGRWRDIFPWSTIEYPLLKDVFTQCDGIAQYKQFDPAIKFICIIAHLAQQEIPQNRPHMISFFSSEKKIQAAIHLVMKYLIRKTPTENPLSWYKHRAHELAAPISLNILIDYSYLTGHIDASERELHLDNGTRAGVLHQAEAPLLHGKDLLDITPPGPALGTLLDQAYQLQIDCSITDPIELKQLLIKKLK